VQARVRFCRRHHRYSEGAVIVRAMLIIVLLFLAAAAVGFFYLVGQADASAPAAHQAEVEVDVVLPN